MSSQQATLLFKEEIILLTLDNMGSTFHRLLVCGHDFIATGACAPSRNPVTP